jgi:O-methyltransferase
VRRGVRRTGWELVRIDPRTAPPPPDVDDRTAATLRAVAKFTLTSPERVIALVDAVRHLSRAGIGGDMVECGVWRGGSMLAVARTLVDEGDTGRELYLFDTFTHMPPPGPEDIDFRGRPAFKDFEPGVKMPELYDYIPKDEVRALIEGTGYPKERIHLVEGLVENTVPAAAPDQIALCRLDTDWYESTLHELTHLWPRLVPGGILLVDDYGHYLGARKAVDEYLPTTGSHHLLHRIDYSGRLVVKPR